MKKEIKKENMNVVEPTTFVGNKFWVEIKGKRYNDFYSIKHGSGFASVYSHTPYPGFFYEFEYIDLETAFTHNEFDEMDGFFLYLSFEEYDGATDKDRAKNLSPREESYYISHVHSFVNGMDQMGIGCVVYRFILEGSLNTYGKCISHVSSEFSDEIKYKE